MMRAMIMTAMMMAMRMNRCKRRQIKRINICILRVKASEPNFWEHFQRRFKGYQQQPRKIRLCEEMSPRKRIIIDIAKYIWEIWYNPRSSHDIELHGTLGDPICVRTRSSHCNGPFRCSSIQQGVEVTVCLRYSAPQPFTKLILMVHIRVSW